MKNIKKKIMALLLALIIAISLCACDINNNNHINDVDVTTTIETTSTATIETSATDMFELNSYGGYEIVTDTMKCIVVADNGYKYSYFESYEGRKIEFYAGPTEMIIVESIDNTTRYYRETYEDIGQVYPNPLTHVYEGLQQMDFEHIETDGNYNVYEAINIVQVETQDKIKYNLYIVEMDWVDGETYYYKYYEYADGATLISAEAPNEINPRITEDTKWVIDLDKPAVRNTETGQEIGIKIIGISSGEATSPDGEPTIEEQRYVVRANVNRDTNRIESLIYINDVLEIEVSVIHEVSIEKPVVTEDMGEIDHSELQGMLMLIYMLESII